MTATSASAKQDPESVNKGWRTYRLYGLSMASDFSFASQMAEDVGPPDLSFSCVPSAPLSNGWEQTEPVYASPPYPDEEGESELLLYDSGPCLIMRFTGISDYYLWRDRILCHLQDPAKYPGLRRNPSYHRKAVEVHLLGLVLACWLEWQGIPALHASAVVMDGRAMAFMSSGGGGKSSSAMTLMQAGCSLLTDDILTLERSGVTYVGRPGYPQMRMWPEQARHFVGRYEDLDLVHPGYSKRCVPVEGDGFGTFCNVSQPLACLYLPERRNASDWGTRIEIKPLSHREAVMALIGHAFAPSIVEALGLHPQRFKFFAQMALQVPVRRIVYPNGFDHLTRVRDAILEDFRRILSALEET